MNTILADPVRQLHLDPVGIANHFRSKEMISPLDFQDPSTFKAILVPFGTRGVDRDNWGIQLLYNHQLKARVFRLVPGA